MFFVDYFDQIQFGQCIGVGQCLQVLCVQFYGYCIEVVVVDCVFDCVYIGLGDVCGVEQGIVYVVVFDYVYGLVGEQCVVGVVDLGISYCIIYLKGCCWYYC